MLKNNLCIGDKVKFKEEKQAYTVRASSDRFAICTKPFNCRRTVLYTIIDLQTKKRAPNDFVFNPYDYTKQSDVDDCMQDLEAGNCELSCRHAVRLNIETINGK